MDGVFVCKVQLEKEMVTERHEWTRLSELLGPTHLEAWGWSDTSERAQHV